MIALGTTKIAWAAATDAANENARKNGRVAWNQDDYNVAVATFNRILPEADDAA